MPGISAPVYELARCEGRPLFTPIFIRLSNTIRRLDRALAEHCHAGWGEIEIHLHHGVGAPDTAENTRRQLVEFRDRLAIEHGCLSYRVIRGSRGTPLCMATSLWRIRIWDRRAEWIAKCRFWPRPVATPTMTLPAGIFHPAQTGKINSLYECGLPLTERAPHRKGARS